MKSSHITVELQNIKIIVVLTTPGMLTNNVIIVLTTEVVLYWHSPIWSSFIKIKMNEKSLHWLVSF